MSTIPAVKQENINAKQYAFKAAFLFNFIEYMDWKNNAESGTFNFAVLGNSPITEQMEVIAHDQRAKNKKISVKEYENIDEIGFCYILFVSKTAPGSIEEVVSKFENKPVLIVTEEKEGSVKKGPYINFFIESGKLKFEINLKSVKKAGIKISSQLLQHAIIYYC
jgi:hypothetical protein